jgi:hypothetical protein
MFIMYYYFFVQVMAIDYGLTVDKEGFNASMEEARQKARNARNKVIFTFLLIVEVNPKSLLWCHLLSLQFLLYMFLFAVWRKVYCFGCECYSTFAQTGACQHG